MYFVRRVFLRINTFLLYHLNVDLSRNGTLYDYAVGIVPWRLVIGVYHLSTVITYLLSLKNNGNYGKLPKNTSDQEIDKNVT